MTPNAPKPSRKLHQEPCERDPRGKQIPLEVEKEFADNDEARADNGEILWGSQAPAQLAFESGGQRKIRRSGHDDSRCAVVGERK